MEEIKMAKEEVKKPRVKKTISQLSDSLGWVSFTKFQLDQIGINPEINTTSDLRKLVFGKLGIVARKPKEEKLKVEAKKE